ncbi:MAG: phage terminase large subunit, partial [Shewanella sp.]
MYGGSRGGGKTDGCLGKWAQRYKLYGGNLRGMFVRRTYDELDEVVARSLEIFPSIGGEWRQQRRTWYFPGGARLKMRPLVRDADAMKYQGHSYTDLFIDEAGNFPDPIPLDKLRATLRNPFGIPPNYTLTANPGGPGHEWLKKRYFDPAPDGFTPIIDPVSGETRIYIPSRLEDNKILMLTDPGYRARIMQSGPSWLVQAWLKGDWNATPEGGLIKA